jgi:hypothetical protein
LRFFGFGPDSANCVFIFQSFYFVEWFVRRIFGGCFELEIEKELREGRGSQCLKRIPREQVKGALVQVWFEKKNVEKAGKKCCHLENLIGFEFAVKQTVLDLLQVLGFVFIS